MLVHQIDIGPVGGLHGCHGFVLFQMGHHVVGEDVPEEVGAFRLGQHMLAQLGFGGVFGKSVQPAVLDDLELGGDATVVFVLF